MTLLEFLTLMRKHLKVLVVGAVAGLLVGAAVALVKTSPEGSYTGTATVYVASASDDADTEGTAKDTRDNLQSGAMLGYDVSQLASSDRVKKDVAQQLGMEESDLDGYTITTNKTAGASRIIPIQVEGSNAEKVADIANAIADDTAKVAQEVLQVPSQREISVSVVDRATAGGAEDSSPSVGKYGAVGLLAGLFVAVCGVTLWYSLDTRVTSGEELENLTDLPVVGSFREIKG